MELLAVVVIILVGIGAIVAGIAGVAVFASYWAINIPLVGLIVGGPIGFFLGIGLVVIILVVGDAVKK